METIHQYRHDSRFVKSQFAFLVTGARNNIELANKNLSLLAKNQTGHWKVRAGAIKPGDAMFLLLPNQDRTDGYPRTLFGGVVTQVSQEAGTLITVEQFHELEVIDSQISFFLGGKTPPQGNLAMTVWKEEGDDAELEECSVEGDEGDEGDEGGLSSAPQVAALSMAELGGELDAEVAKSIMDGAAARKQRLAQASGRAELKMQQVRFFVRNPDVVAERLARAAGVCGDCGNQGPFLSRVTGQYFLEVHHVLPLSKGGEDTVDNTTALCPNCHRRRHHETM